MKPKVLYFILVGIILAVVAGGAAGIFYMNGLVTNEVQNLKLLLAKDTAAEEHLDQLSQLSKQYERLKPKLVNVDRALPRTKQQSELILQLQQIASDAGMSIPSASFSASSGGSLPSATSQTIKAGDASALPITFQLTGTYAQLQTFLHKLETLGRYTNIVSLAISKNQASTLTFALTVNAYIKP